MVQRPPGSRYATVLPHAKKILHDLVLLTQVAVRRLVHVTVVTRLHPRRRPGQMLHTAVKLPTLIRPLHRRRAHTRANLHQAIHDATCRLLVLQHCLESITRQWRAPNGITEPSKSRLLNDEAFATRLIQ